MNSQKVISRVFNLRLRAPAATEARRRTVLPVRMFPTGPRRADGFGSRPRVLRLAYGVLPVGVGVLKKTLLRNLSRPMPPSDSMWLSVVAVSKSPNCGWRYFSRYSFASQGQKTSLA
jgi:hypothetical protein